MILDIKNIWDKQKIKITLNHCYSHTNIKCDINKGNDEADKLATKALKELILVKKWLKINKTAITKKDF